MPLFKSLIGWVPIAGPVVAKVADTITKPIQQPIKHVVNDVTGSRQRENSRLDDQKAQLVREAQQRVAANIQANQHNMREIMEAEVKIVREAIENAERDIANDPNVLANQEESVIPNPFLAYGECICGRTQELSLILQLDRTSDTYNFFMSLNPLREAYLFFIESEISIDALRMLSAHNDASIDAAKINLLENVWSDLNNVVIDHNFNKAKRIISADIDIEGVELFLRKLDAQQSLHKPLIDADIISISNERVTLAVQQTQANNATKPRPGI